MENTKNQISEFEDKAHNIINIEKAIEENEDQSRELEKYIWY